MKEQLDTKLDREFNKTFFSHNELCSATFHFQQQAFLSCLDITLNVNCKVTVSPGTVKAAIHMDTMRAHMGNGNTIPLILKLSTTYRLAISFTK
jgi:hypothetical protein